MQPLPTRPKLAAGPSRHVYDVVVLGGQIGGALSAALLAKRGCRVLLVEHDGLGVGYEFKDFVLPYAPFIAPSLKSMPAAETAFTELGLNTTVQRALRPATPTLQVILPKHRVDLFADPGRRKKELRRELGATGEDVDTALTQISKLHESTDSYFKDPPNFPPDGWMDKWQFERSLKKFPNVTATAPTPGDDPASRLIFGLTPFVTYQAELSGLGISRTLSATLESPNRYPGGREGLREILIKKLSDLGGDYLGPEGNTSAVVESLSFEGGKLVGLKVMQSEVIYRAPYVIAATDAGALRRLLPEKKRHRALSEALEMLNPQRFLFTVNWVAPAELLPKAMGELLILDTDAELGPLLVQAGPARKVGGKVEDESLRVVCASASVPAGTRELGEAHMQKLVERIGAQLDRLMPFVRQKLLASSAPYLDAGGVRGSRLLPHPLYPVAIEQSVLGITGLAPKTPTKNLFLASREVLPGLGLEGELLAGVQAAQSVQELLKKMDPLKR
jgi:phytoene dehydrogenase-like protein